MSIIVEISGSENEDIEIGVSGPVTEVGVSTTQTVHNVEIIVDEFAAQTAKDAAQEAINASVGKLDKDGYTGTAKTLSDADDDLSDRIDLADASITNLETNKAEITYVDSQVSQLLGGAPGDGNTLKELNDKILAVQAIIGGAGPDGDNLVNTVAELLAVFATYTEAVNIVTLLAGKVNTTDVYNALDCIVAGKVADARQLKVLNDAFNASNIRSILGIATLSGANTGDQDLSGKQDISNQIDVPLPASVQNSWHGKTVKFTSSGLLTIPASFTNSGMAFEGLTKTGVTLAWAITSPKTFEFGTPPSVTEKQIFTFMQNDGLNTIIILGL